MAGRLYSEDLSENPSYIGDKQPERSSVLLVGRSRRMRSGREI